LLRYILWR